MQRAVELVGRALLLKAKLAVNLWGDPDKRPWGVSADTRRLHERRKK